MWIEILLVLLVAILYASSGLLDFDPLRLQQSGEHNESSTLPLLAEISVWRYHEIPLWNPFMLTGFPHAGDFVNHFWNPIATLPVLIWGGINGMKVSVFISFILAGIGQWLFARVFGLRGPFRVWASLLFMLSGGLALLWRVGWYELLLGAVWFPWCFAGLWWAVFRRDRTSLVLCAGAIAFVLASGGGYYPIYLLGSAIVLVLMALIFARRGQRRRVLDRAVAIGLLSAGLAGVVLVPLIDGYRYTSRDAGFDYAQRASQPIPYALVNYIVSKPEWFSTDILDTAGGWNWFYIGALPIAALAFVPLAYQSRRRRAALVTIGALTLFLLAWHANKYTPFGYIYQALPFLYQLRFPGRLLIIAASPLIVLAGLGLQHLYGIFRRATLRWFISLPYLAERGLRFRIKWVASAAFIGILFLSASDAYQVNQGVAFAPDRIPPDSITAMRWLRAYDPGPFYVSLAGDVNWWWWTPAAYMMEIPVINFRYNRRLLTWDTQRSKESPFFATPKYMFTLDSQPDPPNAEFLGEFGMRLWRLRDALPFAFSVPTSMDLAAIRADNEKVHPLDALLDGPNRIIVRGTAAAASELVVLESNYPGWRLVVDGKPAPVVDINGYLGAMALEGEHTYTFVFAPRQFYQGLVISLCTLLIALVLMATDLPLPLARGPLVVALRRIYNGRSASSGS